MQILGGRRYVEIPGQGKITYNAYRWSVPVQTALPGGTVQEYEYDDVRRAAVLNLPLSPGTPGERAGVRGTESLAKP